MLIIYYIAKLDNNLIYIGVLEYRRPIAFEKISQRVDEQGYILVGQFYLPGWGFHEHTLRVVAIVGHCILSLYLIIVPDTSSVDALPLDDGSS